MISLEKVLESGKFVVTCELNPPKGTDLGPLLDKAQRLENVVDAFNLTDSHAAHMAMTPLAAAHLMVDRGLEPILQITTRDRNRIALQGDLLGAHALGVHNVVFMGGDPPSTGDHPDAKPVFDVYSSMMLKAAKALQNGHDMAGNPLSGSPRFCLGAVVNPGASDLGEEIARMDEKVQAGASFFQTQAVYDAAAFERFARAAEPLRVPVLAGIIPLKSAKQAQYMNAHVPGITVPEAVMREIGAADDRVATSLAMAARTIGQLDGMCQGLHIMAIGWEAHIPALLTRAGIRS
ncbi:MAG: 5,10-methylenetetrahydrofolate reductase [Gammaproteobacteria bacterium]|nr:5,10-methylenetetrahydrofolate reductase [Gammaproteobacteria bacterium]NIP89138.1 5,10-methylenetetrahydrofolate reductase [Gammaproteobacteria bacterium]NIR23997.1 5,10-methylenetetrahydrofolate reductase [Gammaproteobacteria bacterium]NIS05632.1 5,10-methylenetetrahydrofolate reductase [Gammaproteobacteria bacterium]NIU40946.1 5,10-methylenetetrahydrofolate reductase [Gammaproteobacteria bacterium]